MSTDTPSSATVNSDAQQLLVALIADAAAGFRHAETIVQQRLYNFLMAASILVLAAAASLSASPHPSQKAFLISLAVMGILLSLAYAFLGFRQMAFIDLHMAIVVSLEKQLTNPSHRVSSPIAQMRGVGEADPPNAGEKHRLSRVELVLRSSHFLWAAPLAFAILFGVVLLCALFGLVPYVAKA